jgi:hypothetical protein
LVNFFNIIIYRNEIRYVISAQLTGRKRRREIAKIIVGYQQAFILIVGYQQAFILIVGYQQAFILIVGYQQAFILIVGYQQAFISHIGKYFKKNYKKM